MSIDPCTKSSSGSFDSASAREEIIKILNTEYDENIARVFASIFDPSQFNFTFDRESRFFTIETKSTEAENLTLKCKVMMVGVKIGIIVPPIIVGKLERLERKGNLYNRIWLNGGEGRIHYDSKPENAFLKAILPTSSDDLNYIDIPETKEKTTYHSAILTGTKWINTIDSTKSIPSITRETRE